MKRLLWAALLGPLLAGCGAAASPTLGADPTTYLVRLEQMQSPDFTVATPAASVDAGTLTHDESQLQPELASDGLEAASQVAYFRDTGTLRTSTGPVNVIATAIRFHTAAGAHSWFAAETAARLKAPTAQQISTGPLGDEAFAVSRLADAGGGVSALDIVVEWRTDNIVNRVEVQGRYGGTRLSDALYVARQQQANEAG